MTEAKVSYHDLRQGPVDTQIGDRKVRVFGSAVVTGSSSIPHIMVFGLDDDNRLTEPLPVGLVFFNDYVVLTRIVDLVTGHEVLSAEERNFRWAYAALIELAKVCLEEARDPEDPHEWPGTQPWDELSSTSQAIFLRAARDKAGIPHEAFLEGIRNGWYDGDMLQSPVAEDERDVSQTLPAEYRRVALFGGTVIRMPANNGAYDHLIECLRTSAFWDAEKSEWHEDMALLNTAVYSENSLE